MKKQHTTFRSSTVSEANWSLEENATHGELVVTFTSGTSYIYHDVEKGDYSKFINTESAGAGLNLYIKGVYAFTKLEKEKDGESNN